MKFEFFKHTLIANQSQKLKLSDCDWSLLSVKDIFTLLLNHWSKLCGGRNIVFDAVPINIGVSETLFVCKISPEIVGELEPNLHGYSIRA